MKRKRTERNHCVLNQFVHPLYIEILTLVGLHIYKHAL